MQNFMIIVWFCVALTFITNVVCADGVVSFNLAWSDNKNTETLENTCPNNRTKCTEKQTCCETKHKSYHCCRYPNAVCCPDKYHCCPHGSTCDVRRKRCNRHSDISIVPQKVESQPVEWPVVDETLKVEINEQTCPNNRTKCKDTQTCCATKHHSFHCCKYKNAVCCSDKYHCCPEDSTCDIKRHKCVKSNTKMLRLVIPKVILEESRPDKLDIEVASNLKNDDDDITCPNNKTKCKDSKTCCITKHGNYYCCPHKNAVCCSDKYQCCPQGATCDLKNKKCVTTSSSLDMDVHEWKMDESNYLALAKTNIFDNLVFEQKLGKKCHDNKYFCPGQKDCCFMNGGKYGCCDFNKGVCCPDLKTCCPHGTTCDVTNMKCVAPAKSLIPL